MAPFIEQAAMEASATARRDDAKIFLREFTRELVREINPSTKIITFAILIAAASLLAFIYGQRATDHGLHQLSIVMGAVSAFLLIATLFDRTIPRMTAVAAEPVATTH